MYAIGNLTTFQIPIDILKKRTHSFFEISKKWDPVGPGRMCLLSFLKITGTHAQVPLNGIVIRKYMLVTKNRRSTTFRSCTKTYVMYP